MNQQIKQDTEFVGTFDFPEGGFHFRSVKAQIRLPGERKYKFVPDQDTKGKQLTERNVLQKTTLIIQRPDDSAP
ncbi:hypothetical protein GCM10028803_55090 [Larkinella knui]|uniref:Uncharacterized protein n=1 Tax=Larkinella knui TaxID=2025310 RepID=A0A3P1CGA9_9BACT|nr:hypothetical protein EHT87_19005 [Larkinella knui]